MSVTPTDRTEPGSDSVREALRALATGESPGPGATSLRPLVAEAEAALSSVERAVEYAEAGGFERLRAVADERADGGDDGELDERARAVFDALARYRRAYRVFAGEGTDYFHRALDSHNRGREVGGDN